MEERTLEERVAALEIEVAYLKAESLQRNQSLADEQMPWWKSIVGIFKDSPGFEEAVRLGREWRMSQMPSYEEDEA